MNKTYEKLQIVQRDLKAPKTQYNSFGKYNYRSCEDILEGLKKPLAEVQASVVLSDEIVQVGERYYIKATATFCDTESGEQIDAVGWAREAENKKGMDDAQVTGTTSSYARKYALNGLFAIDDAKDADTDEYNRTKTPQKQAKAKNGTIGKDGARKMLSEIRDDCGMKDIADAAFMQVVREYGVTDPGDVKASAVPEFRKRVIGVINATLDASLGN